ncbi:enoyl-CoA hydratase [Rhodococcus sp. NPDC003322]
MAERAGNTPRQGAGDGDAVLYDRTDGGVAVLTLNRPERLNSWGRDIAAAFYAAVDRAEADPDVRVLLVTGKGRAFCAGADMGSSTDIGDAFESDAPVDVTALMGDRPPHFLTSVHKPVVAAINGPCVGIGLTYALMCDVRFAADGAKFAAPFARRGLIAEHGIAWILPRLAGWGVALDLLLSGRTFLAREAADLGLVAAVLPPEDLFDHALRYCEDMAANCSPASLRWIKDQAYAVTSGDAEDATTRAAELMAESLTRPDVIEGVTAFLAKRPPAFPPLDVRKARAGR